MVRMRCEKLVKRERKGALGPHSRRQPERVFDGSLFSSGNVFSTYSSNAHRGRSSPVIDGSMFTRKELRKMSSVVNRLRKGSGHCIISRRTQPGSFCNKRIHLSLEQRETNRCSVSQFSSVGPRLIGSCRLKVTSRRK